MFRRRARLPVDVNMEPNYDPAQKLMEFASKDDPNEDQIVAKKRKRDTVIPPKIRQVKFSANNF